MDRPAIRRAPRVRVSDQREQVRSARGALVDYRRPRRSTSGGRRGPGNFGYQTGRYVAALLANLNGEEVVEEKLGTTLAAEAWESCAFLEAVKCSPARGVSTPTDAMRRNCPTRYLTEELRVLSPRVLLGVGRPAWTALEDCLDVTLHEERSGFRRGRALLDGAAIEVFFVYHPS